MKERNRICLSRAGFYWLNEWFHYVLDATSFSRVGDLRIWYMCVFCMPTKCGKNTDLHASVSTVQVLHLLPIN